MLFLFWLRLFILSGVISPLISSSILGTYCPGEFIFQCHTFLPFHTVHGVLKARIMKWFAIPFCGPRFVRTLHHDPSILGGPTQHRFIGLWAYETYFIELDKAVVHVISLVSFLWLWFSVCLPSGWRRIRDLWKLPDGRNWLWEKLGLTLFWWAGPCLVNLQSNFLLIGGSVFPPRSLAKQRVMTVLVTSFKRTYVSTAYVPRLL